MDTPPDQRPENWSDGAVGYDESFAAFTAQYVDEMLDRLGVSSGTRLLDVAAGTGTASLRAARRGARVTATDFAPGMVDVLAQRVAAAGHDDAVTAVMDGQDLDLPDDSFDAAVSMFGLMFFPDVRAGLRELGRVVRPGGRIGTATWDLVGFPMHRLVAAALARVLDGYDPASAPPPTWAPLGTADGLREAILSAGFEEVEVAPVERRWTFDDAGRFFLGMPGWSPPMRTLFDALPTAAAAAAAQAFQQEVAGAGGAPGDEGIPTVALLGTATVPPT
jgi:SAM-dependent methyltransferase